MFKIYLDFVLYILYIFIFYILILKEKGDFEQEAPYILFHCTFL